MTRDCTHGVFPIYGVTKGYSRYLFTQHLKNKLGTRQLPTAEVLLDGTEAYMVGECMLTSELCQLTLPVYYNIYYGSMESCKVSGMTCLKSQHHYAMLHSIFTVFVCACSWVKKVVELETYHQC